MFKPSYKIPVSLDKSMLDHEISLASKAQVRLIPLKVLLFYLGSAMLLFWVISSTFVQKADVGLIVLLVIWWVLASVFLGQYSKTKELKIMGLPALLDYLPKSGRRILTRRSNNASGFYSVTGIKALSEEGHVTFVDGTVGQAYLVVGSASILVFEADKQAIINRVDAFYRKLDTTVELLWITTKEPQRVHRQLANLERRNLALKIREPELFALLDEQAAILTHHVGRSFNSIHQYLVVKADHEEALRRMHNLLSNEVEESSLMIKNAQMLDHDGFAEMARALFAYEA